jgi:hypothetical protein
VLVVNDGQVIAESPASITDVLLLFPHTSITSAYALGCIFEILLCGHICKSMRGVSGMPRCCLCEKEYRHANMIVPQRGICKCCHKKRKD